MTSNAKTGAAAVYVGSGKPMEIRNYPVSEPGAHQVLLRLERSGICGTDVHIIEGRLALPAPMILGHEFVGRVEALGDDCKQDGLGSPLQPGDMAIACVALPCGQCFSCKAGETASCMNFGVTYIADPAAPPHFLGGYAEYLFSPAGNLVKIPESVDLDAAAAFPCAGPTVIRACEYGGGLSDGELVVVQGTGPVGLFAIAWAASAGCRVVAIGSGANPRRTQLAHKLGAREVFDYRRCTADERLQRVKDIAITMNRGDGADVVIEASGSPAAIPEGLSLVRTRGRYFVPGQYSASGAISIQPELITFKAIRIIGSGQYALADVGVYLEFLRDNPRVAEVIAGCITHRFRIRQANEAMAQAARGAVIKGVFVGE
jgi:threonine dehydrogenase-like Zn-dependent dehydrogenase